MAKDQDTHKQHSRLAQEEQMPQAFALQQVTCTCPDIY